MIATVEKPARYGAIVTVASGRTGTRIRISPYVPSFSRTPARITEPTVGAFACASGSQMCSGHNGTFTASPTAISSAAASGTPCPPSTGELVSWTRSNVPACR